MRLKEPETERHFTIHNLQLFNAIAQVSWMTGGRAAVSVVFIETTIGRVPKRKTKFAPDAARQLKQLSADERSRLKQAIKASLPRMMPPRPRGIVFGSDDPPNTQASNFELGSFAFSTA